MGIECNKLFFINQFYHKLFRFFSANVEPGQNKPNSNEKRPMIIVLQTHNQIIWLLFARRAKLEYVPSMCSKKKQKSFRLFSRSFWMKSISMEICATVQNYTLNREKKEWQIHTFKAISDKAKG